MLYGGPFDESQLPSTLRDWETSPFHHSSRTLLLTRPRLDIESYVNYRAWQQGCPLSVYLEDQHICCRGTDGAVGKAPGDFHPLQRIHSQDVYTRKARTDFPSTWRQLCSPISREIQRRHKCQALTAEL